LTTTPEATPTPVLNVSSCGTKGHRDLHLIDRIGSTPISKDPGIPARNLRHKLLTRSACTDLLDRDTFARPAFETGDTYEKELDRRHSL
jgi:hypothetical protein